MPAPEDPGGRALSRSGGRGCGHRAGVLEARAQSLGKAISRPLEAAERCAWLAPWNDEQRVRSWTAMAGPPDARYTLDLMPRLRACPMPTLLI